MPQVQFAVQSYVARALPLSAQRTINFYAEQAPKDAKSPVVIYGTPGIKTFCDNVGDGPIRGMEVMDDLLYAVSGDVLYSVEPGCNNIALGSIAGGAKSASAIFEITDGSSGTISSITVDGVEAFNEPVNWTTDDATTAALVATEINEGPLGSDGRDISCGWDLSTATFVADGSIIANHEAMAISDDGQFVFTANADDNLVRKYLLSTVWDITTIGASPAATFDLAAAIHANHNANGITFSPDGLNMYVTDSWLVTVDWLTLPAAWDIGGAVYQASFSVASIANPPRGLFFKSDGTRMFVVKQHEAGGSEITQMDLSTGWDITSAVWNSEEFTITEGGAANRWSGIAFRTGECPNPGTKMYVMSMGFGAGSVIVYQYTLSSAWDVQTAVYDTVSLNVNAKDDDGRGLALSPDGTRLYFSGKQNDKVYQYALDSTAVTIEGLALYSAEATGAIVIITSLSDGGEANGLPVVITTTGDVQVDNPTTTIDGGFTMPAIIETTGGGGVPLTSPDCVSMSHNQASPSQLIIVDGTNGWIYTTTGGLVQIIDEDFFSADVVDFQDQYFVLNRAGTGQFFISNLNDGTAYLATDIATAEGDPDNLVALISNRRELWLFGAETIEVWYNSGDLDFPFNRFEGGTIERGLAAAFSIAEDDNSLFWLGEDRIFYRADGYLPQRISQHGIEEAIRQYKIVSDACAFIYTMGGHKFYVCTFPAEDATWVYDITTGLWHERQSVGMGRWRVNTHVEAYGKHLVGDFEKGRIGELDLDTFEEWGVVMQGQATGPVVYADRQRIFHRRFELDIDAGPGLTSGQGSDPQVWLDYSDDGGHTWSARKPFRSMGKIGAYLQRLRWLRLGSARQRIYRINVSDPVVRSIVAAHLDAAAGDH